MASVLLLPLGVFRNPFFQCSDSLVLLSLPVAVIAISTQKGEVSTTQKVFLSTIDRQQR
jgi:hypothetical protein